LTDPRDRKKNEGVAIILVGGGGTNSASKEKRGSPGPRKKSLRRGRARQPEKADKSTEGGPLRK